MRAGTKSIRSSLDLGADPRVCTQQVLRKYLFSEGRKEAGRGPVESESGPKSVDVDAPLTSHLPRTPVEMKFPAMTW